MVVMFISKFAWLVKLPILWEYFKYFQGWLGDGVKILQLFAFAGAIQDPLIWIWYQIPYMLCYDNNHEHALEHNDVTHLEAFHIIQCVSKDCLTFTTQVK